MDPDAFGRGLYISHGADLTLNSQRLAAARTEAATAALPPHARADVRFWWNRSICAPLIEAKADRFVLTAILGFVGQVQRLKVTVLFLSQ